MKKEPIMRDVAQFAKEYVRLTEALMREGVPEDEARSEARMTALILVTVDTSDLKCQNCGSPFL